VDAARLLQIVRHQLRGDSVGGLYLAEGVPSLLSAVLAGRTEELAGLADALVGDDPYCDGYAASCAPDGRGVTGVDLTVLCRDIAPFAASAVARAGEGRVGFEAAFARSPYWDVCESWPVGPAEASVAEPVRSAVPVLAMVGAFDPAVRVDALRSGLGGLERLTVVVDPAGGHNVMPRTDCLLGLRLRFLDNPTQALDTGCLTALTPSWP
ncbi:MAG: alpha/beta hydrolase, partial [Frankiaceae bacterium]|nr:alpha/beta hydrolase [Frankiaceae bacterium]